MSIKQMSLMEFKAGAAGEDQFSSDRMHDLWPLDKVNANKAKFPCCLVWTSLPIVSWLAPYMGHVGICREDGVVLDFSGSHFVGSDGFSFGSVARYLQLDREQCCFPPNLAGHTCEQSYRHAELGTAISWDDALHSSMLRFQHKSYNLFTCNCYSFVANCLNLLAYNGSVDWNALNISALILWRGRWVDGKSIVRSFFPFTLMLFIGIYMAGWPFLVGLAVFSLLLLGWNIIGIYCVKNLIE